MHREVGQKCRSKNPPNVSPQQSSLHLNYIYSQMEKQTSRGQIEPKASTVSTGQATLKQNQFARCAFRPRCQSNVFIVVLNGHTWRQNEKPPIIGEEGDVISFKYGDDGEYFQAVSKVTQIIVSRKREKKSQRGKFKPCFLSPSTDLANHRASCLVNCRIVGFEEKWSDAAHWCWRLWSSDKHFWGSTLAAANHFWYTRLKLRKGMFSFNMQVLASL